MKKLLRFLSSMSLVFPLSSTMIACEGSDEESNDDTQHNEEDNSDINDSAAEVEKDLIADALTENGIDGTGFNTSNTGADILDIIVAKLKALDPEITDINFVNAEEADKNLEVGENLFTVSYNLNGEEVQYSALVKNIADANNLNNEEAEVYINGVLDDPELLVNDGETQTSGTDQITQWTNAISQKIGEKVHGAEVHITSSNQSDPTKGELTVEVDRLPSGFAKIKRIMKYADRSRPVAENNTYENMIQKELMMGINASFLNEDTTYYYIL